MFWIGLYILLIVLFVLQWRATYYRTPDEEALDIKKETKYWRKETIRKREFDKDWKEYVKRMKIILYGNGNSLKSKSIINANCKIDKEIK